MKAGLRNKVEHTSKNERSITIHAWRSCTDPSLLSGDGMRRGVPSGAVGLEGSTWNLVTPVHYITCRPRRRQCSRRSRLCNMNKWHAEMYKVFRDLRMRADIDRVVVFVAKDAAVRALWQRSVGWALCALCVVARRAFGRSGNPAHH